MKRIILIVMGILLLILGIVGLILPVIPQVPFLFGSACLLVYSSKKIKMIVLHNELYKKHLEPHIRKNRYLKQLWERITSRHDDKR